MTIDLEPEHFDMAAAPTNFSKRIADKNYNSYHFMHIDSLRKIAAITGDDVFAIYADRWENYAAQWPDIQMYRDAGVELERRP